MIYDLPFAVEPMYEREISEIEKFKVGGLLLQARILINFQREREKKSRSKHLDHVFNAERVGGDFARQETVSRQ